MNDTRACQQNQSWLRARHGGWWPVSLVALGLVVGPAAAQEEVEEPAGEVAGAVVDGEVSGTEDVVADSPAVDGEAAALEGEASATLDGSSASEGEATGGRAERQPGPSAASSGEGDAPQEPAAGREGEAGVSETWESYTDGPQASVAQEITKGVRVEDIVEPPSEYRYAAFGKADPFRPPMVTKASTEVEGLEIPIVSPLQRFPLASLRVIGIWQLATGERKAMVLAPAASQLGTGGQGIIVKVGDPVGNRGGKVLGIGADFVTVREFTLSPDGARQYEDQQMLMGQGFREDPPAKIVFKPGKPETEILELAPKGSSVPRSGGGALDGSGATGGRRTGGIPNIPGIPTAAGLPGALPLTNMPGMPGMSGMAGFPGGLPPMPPPSSPASPVQPTAASTPPLPAAGLTSPPGSGGGGVPKPGGIPSAGPVDVKKF